MAGTVISNRLPPNIDITKAPLAYGKRALPKLVSFGRFCRFARWY